MARTDSGSELIVVTRGARAGIDPDVVRESLAAQSRLVELLPEGGAPVRIFGPPDRLPQRIAGTVREDVGAEYLNYFAVRGVGDELEAVADRLRADDAVEAAYVKPPAEPPIAPPV